jgi:hypothetical protein
MGDVELVVHVRVLADPRRWNAEGYSHQCCSLEWRAPTESLHPRHEHVVAVITMKSQSLNTRVANSGGETTRQLPRDLHLRWDWTVT